MTQEYFKKVFNAKIKRMQNRENRFACLQYYSQRTMQCAGWNQEGCPFNCEDPRCLSIDHIEGHGAQHRRNIKRQNLYLWLIQNNFPEGFQVLCMNCQWIKRRENGEEKRSEWC